MPEGISHTWFSVLIGRNCFFCCHTLRGTSEIPRNNSFVNGILKIQIPWRDPLVSLLFILNPLPLHQNYLYNKGEWSLLSLAGLLHTPPVWATSAPSLLSFPFPSPHPKSPNPPGHLLLLRLGNFLWEGFLAYKEHCWRFSSLVVSTITAMLTTTRISFSMTVYVLHSSEYFTHSFM